MLSVSSRLSLSSVIRLITLYCCREPFALVASTEHDKCSGNYYTGRSQKASERYPRNVLGQIRNLLYARCSITVGTISLRSMQYRSFRPHHEPWSKKVRCVAISDQCHPSSDHQWHAWIHTRRSCVMQKDMCSTTDFSVGRLFSIVKNCKGRSLNSLLSAAPQLSLTQESVISFARQAHLANLRGTFD